MAEVVYANLNCIKSRVKGYVKPYLLLVTSNQSPADLYSAGLETQKKKRGRLLKQHTLC